MTAGGAGSPPTEDAPVARRPEASADPRGAPVRVEPGSFRDREGRVFYGSRGVLRALSADALEEWRRLAATGFFPRLVAAGKCVRTEEVDAAGEALPEGGWAGVLLHERVPFVSHPYEWCFGMLKDAAALQLEILEAALAEDFTLKDATPYNVQWFGARPAFIDVPSLVALPPNEPWVGYRQFCEACLYPLILQAYKGVAFQPWLRGRLDGIPAREMSALMSLRDQFRPGVLLNVTLLAKMIARHEDTGEDARRKLREVGFKKELIVANVRRLRKLVAGLEWKQARSTWSDYAEHNTYDRENRARKAAFVREACAERPRGIVWDLGANTGEYARIAAESAGVVVAMDADHLAVERLYRELAQEGNERVLPLVVNLVDASPDQGWRGTERRSLPARGRPDMALALALIHHVVIGANVPLTEFVGWLAGLGTDLVIEFVGKDDPMVKKLLVNKKDHYADYEQGFFERVLERSFSVVRREVLQDGRRVMYHARRR